MFPTRVGAPRPDADRFLVRPEALPPQFQAVLPEADPHAHEVSLLIGFEGNGPVHSPKKRESDLHPGERVPRRIDHPPADTSVLRRHRGRRESGDQQQRGGPAGGVAPAEPDSGKTQKVNRAPSWISRGGCAALGIRKLPELMMSLPIWLKFVRFVTLKKSASSVASKRSPKGSA